MVCRLYWKNQPSCDKKSLQYIHLPSEIVCILKNGCGQLCIAFLLLKVQIVDAYIKPKQTNNKHELCQ